MSNRTETPEYNIYYEEDGDFEYDGWEADLGEVQHFYSSLGENPTQADAFAQARIVQRTRVTFATDWEFLD